MCITVQSKRNNIGAAYGETSEQRKNFRRNVKHRFEVRDGELWYNRGRRTRKRFPHQMVATCRPWVMIPRQGRMWDIVEKDHREHHGKALHPQTQGLVERGNGQLKKRILKAGMDQGHKHSNSTFDWGDVLDKELVKENDAPKAVYGGLSAFFCLRNRARDCTNLRVVPSEMGTIQIYARLSGCTRQ